MTILAGAVARRSGGSGILLSGRREAVHGVWRWLRGLLILAQLVSLCWLPVMWLGGDPVNGVGLALLLADIVALIWLLTNQRLRACFFP